MACALVAAGCGGGVFVSIGDNGNDDDPRVTLAASPSSGLPGDTVRLIAAASDDFGILEVAFYREDSDGGSTLLTRDGDPPYEVDTVLPPTSDSSVRYFARAIDDIGQSDDSNTVTVTLLP
jgi:hypothetical protein